MRKKHYVSFFLLLVVIGTTFFIFVEKGYFPVAIVNSTLITQRHYEKSVTAFMQYQEMFVKTYSRPNAPLSERDLDDIRRLILEQVIENTLIRQEVKRRLGSEAEVVIKNKIAGIIDNQKLKEAAAAISGLNFEDFVELLLKPLAEQEILDGRLFLEKVRFEDWLKQARNSARVTILIANLSWENGEIKVKN